MADCTREGRNCLWNRCSDFQACPSLTSSPVPKYLLCPSCSGISPAVRATAAGSSEGSAGGPLVANPEFSPAACCRGTVPPAYLALAERCMGPDPRARPKMAEVSALIKVGVGRY